MAVKFAFVPPDLVLVHFEDVTERKQAEHQLIQRLNELSSLHQIAKTLAAKRELTQALELVCKTINGLFDTQLTLIALQADESTQHSGLIGVDRSGGAVSLPSAESTSSAISLLQSLPAHGKSRAIADLQALPLPDALREYARANHLSTCLIIPLMSRGTAQGCLILAQSGSRSFFDEKKMELAETIATDIAAAVENERLTEQARAAAVGAERQRLARELHDSVTQSIYSLTLLSSGWESMARQGTLEDPADSFHRLGAVSQQALREMRLLIHQLRPSDLEELGLANALQKRLDTVERRSNIDAQLTVQGDLAGLPPHIEDELFNIAQEALNNSLRHAMARCVRVLIQEDQGKVALSVEDDGVGFNDSAKHFGMGLRNMQERAGFIGGEYSIQSLAEHGTRVTITVDLGKKK
jgi:signal transduction histidine kinase